MIRYTLFRASALLVTLFLVNCASHKVKKATVVNGEFKNPYKPGTYEHFVAEPNYPKTYNVWTNQQLLADLKPGKAWIRIDLAKQRGFLMESKDVVLDYPICSGIPSRPTPRGNYKILEKVVDKSSNLYGKIVDAEGNIVNGDADATKDPIPEGGKFIGAPMGYWMRLTQDGVGHHIGPILRRPASHSCVRGPKLTMPIVYSKVKIGTRVVID